MFVIMIIIVVKLNMNIIMTVVVITIHVNIIYPEFALLSKRLMKARHQYISRLVNPHAVN